MSLRKLKLVGEVPSAKADSDKKSECVDAGLKARSTYTRSTHTRSTYKRTASDAELKLGSTWRGR